MGMRCVAVIENPASGSASARRVRLVREAIAALRGAGKQVDHLVIDGPGSGARLAQQAIESGCDTVLVCGGDGTVHQVLQPVVGSGVALGVLPLGTANALAANLGLARSPEKAICALLEAATVEVPVGRISYRAPDGTPATRYFTVAAGVGPDALLMARMDPVLKRRFGYALYLVEAFRLWAGYPFPLFEVILDGSSSAVHASQILAVRIRSFGGVLGRLVPGASLRSPKLSVIAFKTRSRFRYLGFLLAAMTGRHAFSHDVELITTASLECRPRSGEHPRIFVEADGEVLGHLPVRIEMARETLHLLIPQGAQP
jgi:diacylglycerol kinase (ATP)